MKFWLSVRHTVASVTLPTWKVGEGEFTVTTHAAVLLLRCGYGGGYGYGGDGDCLLRSVHFRSFVQVLSSSSEMYGGFVCVGAGLSTFFVHSYLIV